jgi:hypothetical protein
MTIKIDNQEPNVFPLVEGIDVRDAGRTAEVILATKVEGELVTVTIRLSYGQAATLADLLEPFRKNQCFKTPVAASRGHDRAPVAVGGSTSVSQAPTPKGLLVCSYR